MFVTDYRFGDEVLQIGDHNIGIIKNEARDSVQDALRELVALVAALRSQVPDADRDVIDSAMGVITVGDSTDKGSLRRALSNIAGIAAVVGEVGVPVIEAIRKVAAAFGWG
jgi:hypothetical protein